MVQEDRREDRTTRKQEKTLDSHHRSIKIDEWNSKFNQWKSSIGFDELLASGSSSWRRMDSGVAHRLPLTWRRLRFD